MVKCEDCLRLIFEGPNHECSGEWWGHSCNADEIDGEGVEITVQMIKANRKCPSFKQFACSVCGKLLKHEFEGDDEDLCGLCSSKYYDDMARAEGLIR